MEIVRLLTALLTVNMEIVRKAQSKVSTVKHSNMEIVRKAQLKVSTVKHSS